MVKQSIDTSHMKSSPPSEQLFPVEREYVRCVNALNRSGILTLLPNSQNLGALGIDGKEYPIPTQEQVIELFAQNRELVSRKVPQGFDNLELTPLAMPTALLIDRLKAAILKHAREIYQTRLSPSDPLVAVRVNKEKHVWVWETLKQALDTDELVYFPQAYSSTHKGLTKLEVVNNGQICAVAGWSVGLVESSPIMPQQGLGKTIGGRKQLEVGCSPNEYLHTLQAQAYQGETGKTLEDFITKFLTHLESTNEVSNDVSDNNALWCLGQYLKIPYADCVPAGRWIRSVGRTRLDLHRSNNKKCTKFVGGSTTVRLPKP
ncbi:hypothetical protein [Candidatus Chlorohelix sp.]|uniref:hypothetical protein n=1 Tax=Candidatus Chlorohelix sp. TaxID=3139201 RepID=UPI0030487B53